MRFSQLLKAKLHHARITYADPEYIGSVQIDAALMARLGLRSGELVHVWSVDGLGRVQTYAFPGPAGVIGLNGGAARHFQVGERVVIAAFDLSDQPITPVMLELDERNRIVRELTLEQVESDPLGTRG